MVGRTSVQLSYCLMMSDVLLKLTLCWSLKAMKTAVFPCPAHALYLVCSRTMKHRVSCASECVFSFADRYYSGEMHRAAFVLPKFARDALTKSLTL